MQTVPACQNLYKNSFTYHCLQDEKTLQFDDANQFLGQSFLFYAYSLVEFFFPSFLRFILCILFAWVFDWYTVPRIQ